jgi:hypothetical protein
VTAAYEAQARIHLQAARYTDVVEDIERLIDLGAEQNAALPLRTS